MLTAEQESAVLQVLSSLRAELSNAYGVAWGAATSPVGGDPTNVISALEKLSQSIDKLSGPELVKARILQWDVDIETNWAAFASTIHDGIAYQAGIVGPWDQLVVLDGALRQTGSDLGDVGHQVVSTVESVGGGFGVGAILGLVVVIWVLR